MGKKDVAKNERKRQERMDTRKSEFKTVKPPKFWSSALDYYKVDRLAILSLERVTALSGTAKVEFYQKVEADWSAMTEEEKTGYNTKGQEDKNRYELERTAYHEFREALNKKNTKKK